MKQWIFGILIVGIIAVCGPINAQAVSTNSFTIKSYAIDYYLNRDTAQRSTLKTVETITADFPQSNQNHGLERALPTKYDGHKTDLTIESVTDRFGKKINYSTQTSNGNTVLRIGDKNAYAHGSNTYVITYLQRDVTKYFSNTDRDEFYWDTNGIEWAVPIDSISVRLHLDPSLGSAATGETKCYQGSAKSTDTCTLIVDGNTISTTVGGLRANENVTIAVGFDQGTFSMYQQTPMEKFFSVLLSYWLLALVPSILFATVCFVLLSRRYRKVSQNEGQLGTIIPEYLPPAGHSIMVSAQIEGFPSKVLSAALIDLAVRHYIKIYQTTEKSFFKVAEYELELVKLGDDLSKEEEALLGALFPNGKPGSRFVMSSMTKDYKVSKAILAATVTDVAADIKAEYGLRHRVPEQSRWFKRMGLAMILVGLVTLSPLLLFGAIMAYGYASSLWPLTTTGLALRRYLKGLKLYISVAETDRLKMLQSPEGAQKVGTIGSDAGQLVTLYERVLPYAILFNQETEWNKQLGAQYESTNNQPDWYSGIGAFNALAFGSAMSNFNTTSSYQSSVSSSSGGSSGGGSSGGGGGGGGGGGW